MKLYGKGSIKELEKGKKYRIRFSCGKDPVTGEYRVVSETFVGTKRQAELRVEQIRRELEQGKRPYADKMKFSDWCEQYLSTREGMGKKRPKTYKTDRCYSRHLVGRIGGTLLPDITPAAVNSLYAAMRADGVGDTTVYQCHKLLKRIMRYALDNDMILRNPCDRVETPKKPKPNRNALSKAEASRLSTICTQGEPDAHRVAVFLGLSLGARLGEVLGLRWRNVHISDDRPYIRIVEQYTGGGKTGPLKTDKDDAPNPGRIVPIDGTTVSLLRAWNAVQRAQLNKLGIEQGNDTPVVSGAFGGFVEQHNFNNWFRSFCAANGYGRFLSDDGREIVELRIGEDSSFYPPETIIQWRDADGWPCDGTGKRFSRSNRKPKVKKHYSGLVFHELRHTHFTMRLASGMDIPTAQALGGWSSPSMLMDVYAHPVSENIWRSAGFMDALTAKA